MTIPGEQDCPFFALTTEPETPIFSYEQPGQMGTVHHFTLRDEPHDALTITARSDVETLHSKPFADIDLLTEDWAMLSDAGFHARYAEWLAPTALIPLKPLWPGPPPQSRVFAFAQAVSDAIYNEFQYVPGATDLSTPLAQFVAGHRGVCQDYAHLMLTTGRRAGIPARYVSGYVYPGKTEGETQGGGATHAWVEFFLPASGVWKGFDPTNNIIVADKHIKVAVGRDYADVPPTHGLLRARPGQRLPRATGLEVSVQIEPVADFISLIDENGRFLARAGG